VRGCECARLSASVHEEFKPHRWLPAYALDEWFLVVAAPVSVYYRLLVIYQMIVRRRLRRVRFRRYTLYKHIAG
jgi:hypothetical protein